MAIHTRDNNAMGPPSTIEQAKSKVLWPLRDSGTNVTGHIPVEATGNCKYPPDIPRWPLEGTQRNGEVCADAGAR